MADALKTEAAAELIMKVYARGQASRNLTVLWRVGLEDLLVCPLLLSAPLDVQQLIPPCMGRLRSQRRSLMTILSTTFASRTLARVAGMARELGHTSSLAPTMAPPAVEGVRQDGSTR